MWQHRNLVTDIGMGLLLIFWWEAIFLYGLNAGNPGNMYFANCGRPCWVPTFLYICSSIFCVQCYEHLSSACWSRTNWHSQSRTSEAGLLQQQYLQYLSFPGTSIGEVGKVLQILLWQDVLQAWHTIKKQKGTQFRSFPITYISKGSGYLPTLCWAVSWLRARHAAGQPNQLEKTFPTDAWSSHFTTLGCVPFCFFSDRWCA